MHLESIPESMFRETEAGLIPTEWKCLPLKAIVTFTRKPRGLDLSSLEEIPFVPMELISEQDVYITQYALLTNEEIKSSTYCERGDLLIAKITPSFENGKQGILADIPLDFAFATTEVYALKAIACAVDLLFLFAYFKLDYVRENIAGKMEGTTGRQRVPKSILANYPIPLPTLPEQRRIATALNTIQDEIAAQGDLINALHEFKRSAMARLFTYGAGETPAETKMTEVGEIPVGWELKQVKDIAEKPQYGYTASATDKNTGVKFLRITDITDVGVRWGAVPYCEIDVRTVSKYLLREGDLVFARTGATTGKSHLIKDCPNAVFASYLIRLRAQPHIVPGYIAQYFETEMYWRQITSNKAGSAQAGINATKLQNLLIPTPSSTDQNKIVMHLTAIDDKIATEEDRKTALQDFFRSMLQQLMTGQIRLLSDEGLERLLNGQR